MWLAERVLACIDQLSQYTGKVFSFLYLFVVGVIVYEVVLRYFFNAPTVWAQETIQYVSGVGYVMGGAYALYAGAHVKVEVLYERFQPRVRAILDVITAPFFFLFAAALVRYGGQFAWESLMMRETTFSGWAPPIYPIKLAIPIGALLLLLQGLAGLGRALRTSARGAHER